MSEPERTSEPERKEIPDLVVELVDLSREYLREQTVEPLKRLGRHLGFGLAAGLVLAAAALYLGLAAYAGWKQLLPEGEWWTVAARGLTGVVTGGAAVLIMWRAIR